jgi:aminopeptidase N
MEIASNIIRGMIHQWLDNIIPPLWWSHQWLNEAFATFFHAEIFNKVNI